MPALYRRALKNQGERTCKQWLWERPSLAQNYNYEKLKIGLKNDIIAVANQAGREYGNVVGCGRLLRSTAY